MGHLEVEHIVLKNENLIFFKTVNSKVAFKYVFIPQYTGEKGLYFAAECARLKATLLCSPYQNDLI